VGGRWSCSREDAAVPVDSDDGVSAPITNGAASGPMHRYADMFLIRAAAR